MNPSEIRLVRLLLAIAAAAFFVAVLNWVVALVVLNHFDQRSMYTQALLILINTVLSTVCLVARWKLGKHVDASQA